MSCVRWAARDRFPTCIGVLELMLSSGADDTTSVQPCGPGCAGDEISGWIISELSLGYNT